MSNSVSAESEIISEPILNDSTQVLPFLVSDPSSPVKLPVTSGHYPSKLYLPQNAANTLLGAASALLALNSSLKRTQNCEDLSQLQRNLINEIHAFEHQAHCAGYNIETVMLARYGLCALLDETVNRATWGQSWSEDYALLMYFHGETEAGEQFFKVLARLCEDPARSVDILELLYCCLSQGYEGQFHQVMSSQSQIDSLLEQVYQSICQVRPEVSLWQVPKQKIKATNSPSVMTLPKTFLTASLLLCLIYGAFQYLLQISAEPINPILVRIAHHAKTQQTI